MESSAAPLVKSLRSKESSTAITKALISVSQCMLRGNSLYHLQVFCSSIRAFLFCTLNVRISRVFSCASVIRFGLRLVSSFILLFMWLILCNSCTFLTLLTFPVWYFSKTTKGLASLSQSSCINWLFWWKPSRYCFKYRSIFFIHIYPKLPSNRENDFIKTPCKKFDHILFCSHPLRFLRLYAALCEPEFW